MALRESSSLSLLVCSSVSSTLIHWTVSDGPASEDMKLLVPAEHLVSETSLLEYIADLYLQVSNHRCVLHFTNRAISVSRANGQDASGLFKRAFTSALEIGEWTRAYGSMISNPDNQM